MNFNYLQKTTSQERMSTYLTLANGDEQKAYELYLENIEISKRIYALINEFEVRLRNEINRNLCKYIGQNWYDRLPLIDSHEQAVTRTTHSLKAQGGQVTNPNIISALNFGFWVRMFNKDYDRILWRTTLYKIFPNKRISRSNIRGKLEHIRKTRNRIAHCECIIKRDHEAIYNDIIELASWIDYDFAKWLQDAI